MKSCFLNWHLGEGVVKREPSYTIGRNVNWYSHCGKQYGGSLKKLKIELPYDPAIPLLGIYLGKTKTLIQKDTCTPVFIAAIFIVAKIWKQAKHPLADEWIKKRWNIYIYLYMYVYVYISMMEYYSAIKNETVICSNMDESRDYHTK